MSRLYQTVWTKPAYVFLDRHESFRNAVYLILEDLNLEAEFVDLRVDLKNIEKACLREKWGY